MTDHPPSRGLSVVLCVRLGADGNAARTLNVVGVLAPWDSVTASIILHAKSVYVRHVFGVETT
jgi:hypothetical protein